MDSIGTSSGTIKRNRIKGMTKGLHGVDYRGVDVHGGPHLTLGGIGLARERQTAHEVPQFAEARKT